MPSKTKSKPGFKRRSAYIFSRSSSVVPTGSKTNELSKFSKTTLKKKPTTSSSSPGFFRNFMSRFTRRRDATIEPAITMTSNPLNKSRGGGSRREITRRETIGLSWSNERSRKSVRNLSRNKKLAIRL